jgi:hypothetical protein
MNGQGAAARIPFTSAALRYRELFHTRTGITLGAAAQDVSPPGNAIKSYGYLRRLLLVVTGSGGSGGALAADAPWNFFSQISVTQPNGEEMFGGPTFTGYHAFLAALNSGRYLNDNPLTWPSFVGSAPNFRFVLPIDFEIDTEHGVGALPNQDFSAPWKLQLTVNTSSAVFQTAPTTAPTFTVEAYIDCWTVPSPTNPLNPSIQQEVAPPLLGTLSKWSLQQYTVPASSAFNVLLQRKGNAIRNLVFVIRNSAGARLATTVFPKPLAVRWDGVVIRASDDPLLIVDDEYRVRGGEAAATPVTPQAGVMAIKMSDIAGIDVQGAGENFGMGSFWGTVQSSTLDISGTWGAAAATLEVLTNDVQFVDLAGNPYAFAYGGYLQAPAQAGARP